VLSTLVRLPTNFLIKSEQPSLDCNVKVLFCSIFTSSNSALPCIDFFKGCPLVLLMTLVLGEVEYRALVEWYWQGKSKYFEKNLSLCKSVHQKFETSRAGNEPDRWITIQLWHQHMEDHFQTHRKQTASLVQKQTCYSRSMEKHEALNDKAGGTDSYRCASNC